MKIVHQFVTLIFIAAFSLPSPAMESLETNPEQSASAGISLRKLLKDTQFRNTLLNKLKDKRLDLQNLQLTDLHGLEELPTIETCEHCRLSENQLPEVPLIVTRLTRLQSLHLSGNCIKELPVGIFAKLTQLQFLGLAFNQLKVIPVDRVAGLTSLRFLGLLQNQLTKENEEEIQAVLPKTTIYF